MALTLEQQNQLKLLTQANEAEIIALRQTLIDQGVSKAERDKIVANEKKLNSQQLTAAKADLKAGETITTTSLLTSSLIPPTAATTVNNVLNQANTLYTSLGIPTVTQIKTDGSYTGVPLKDLTKAVLNGTDAGGNFIAGSGDTLLSNATLKLLNTASDNYGKVLSADEVGKVKQVGTDANGTPIYTSTVGWNDQRTGYQLLVQNADGTYTNVGNTASTIPPQDSGGFFQSTIGKIALGVGAALTGGALAPYVGAALGTGAAASGAIAGGLTGAAASGLTGGNVLTGAVLGGVGGAVTSGGLSGVGDTLSQAFSDITGLNVGDIQNVFRTTQGTSAAEFAAADALTMAKNGLGTSAIQQNLIASGMDSLTAATLANNAVMSGATVSGLASTIANQPLYTNVAGMLTGGDAFATTDSVYKQLVSSGMTPEQAAQTINTTGGGLGLNNVSVDSAGNLVQAGGSVLGATAGGSTVADTLKKLITPSTVGGLLTSVVGTKQAQADKADRDAAAAAIEKAAANAAAMQQFKPIGMTTRFGSTTTPTYDAQGRLTGFGYTAAEDIAAQRDRLLSLSGEALPTTTNLTQATTDYYNQLQALQQPGREQELAALQSRLQATGRGGLAFGATTGTGGANALAATNPELAAYYNALAQTQAQQALTAEQYAQQRLANQITTSGNLFTQAGALETAAQQPMNIGLNIGQTATAGSTTAANTLYDAALRAAQARLTGNLDLNRAQAAGLAGATTAAGGLLSTAANAGINYLSNLV